MVALGYKPSRFKQPDRIHRNNSTYTYAEVWKND